MRAPAVTHAGWCARARSSAARSRATITTGASPGGSRPFAPPACPGCAGDRRPGDARQDRIVQVDQPMRDDLVTVLRLDPGAAVAADRNRHVARASRGWPTRRPWRHRQAPARPKWRGSWPRISGDPARVGGHHGQPARQGLDRHDAERLPPAGVHEEARPRHRRGHPGPVRRPARSAPRRRSPGSAARSLPARLEVASGELPTAAGVTGRRRRGPRRTASRSVSRPLTTGDSPRTGARRPSVRPVRRARKRPWRSALGMTTTRSARSGNASMIPGRARSPDGDDPGRARAAPPYASRWTGSRGVASGRWRARSARTGYRAGVAIMATAAPSG